MALFKNKASSLAQSADVMVPRTKFHNPPTTKTTLNAGDIIPVRIFEILPGQTKSLNPAELCRSLTPIVPVMDNAFLDIDCFFVPMRLLWDDWENFQGNNPDAPWANTTTYTIPAIPPGTPLSPASSITSGTVFAFGVPYTLWDYFGLPLYSSNTVTDFNYTNDYVSILPFRGYGLICTEFYFSEAVDTPLLIQKGPYSPATSGNIFQNLNADSLPSMFPLRSSRFHDYFSDALPAPQKGAPVAIPGLEGIPVTTSPTRTTPPSNASPLFWQIPGGSGVANNTGLAINSAGNTTTNPAGAPTSGSVIIPSNLVTGSAVASGATIAALRTAFQIQKILERDSYGTRYTEILRNHFGVISPDARLQRPEYLGGARISLNMSQVVQTSSTDSTSPQGNTAAYSKTVHSNQMFTKSFVEHGYLYVLATVRTERTYQQGIPLMFSRRTRYDFYMPELALISNTAIKRSEIFGMYDSSNSSEALEAGLTPFGYKEAWDEYRCPFSQVTGGFRTDATDSLDVWTYSDFYASPPILSSSWMHEGPDRVNRTLAVPASEYVHNQFLLDVYFEGDDILPMPATSIPGLVDHF